jgi:hypothetical protein
MGGGAVDIFNEKGIEVITEHPGRGKSRQQLSSG